MTSKEKIRDIKSLINEFYHERKCNGTLTECARECWLGYQQDCDDILKDLERLEKENHIKDGMIKFFETEYKKLEKAIEILKRTEELFVVDDEPFYLLHNMYDVFNITKQEYELLKEVISE